MATQPDDTTTADQVRDAYSRRSTDYIDLVDGAWPDHADDTDLIQRHLTGLAGPVLDLGCGPGHWTARLHALGAQVTGVDLVPEFVAHARTHHPGPGYRLGSLTDVAAAEHLVAGILAWYSTIHCPPVELDDVLAGFRRLLVPRGVLVIGFFDSADEVAPFDHAVLTAYRWPAQVMADRLAAAGFAEVERVLHQRPERPDRRYAAIAAQAR